MLDILPEVNLEYQLIPSPQAMLDQRVRKGKNEILIHWKGLSPVEATWEHWEIIQERFLDLILEDEDVSQGRGICYKHAWQSPLLVNVYNSGSLTIRPKTSSSFILAIFFINLNSSFIIEEGSINYFST